MNYSNTINSPQVKIVNDLAEIIRDTILSHDATGALGLGAMSGKQKDIVAPKTFVCVRLRQLWSWYLATGDELSDGFSEILKEISFNAFNWEDFKRQGQEVLDRVKPGEWSPPPTEAEQALAEVKDWRHLDECAVELAGSSKFPDDAISIEIIPPGSLLWEMMEFIRSNEIRPQPLFRIAGALAWASNMFGRKIRTDCGLRSNLNILNIGRTACGKDAAVGCLDNARLHAETKNNPEDNRVDNGSQGDAGLGRSLANSPALLSIVDESGIEITEMLIGEGQAHKSRLTAAFLKLATMKGKRFRLPKYADSARDVEVAEPCWTFFGVTNEATISKALTGANIASGFLPRCLVFWTNDFPDKVQMVETDPSQQVILLSQAWRSWFPNGQTAEQWRDLPSLARFSFSNDAKNILKRSQARWGKMEASDSPMAAMFTRAEEIAKKVALILAANIIVNPAQLDATNPEPIPSNLVGAACDIVDWSIRSACRLIQQYAEDTPQGAVIKAVLEKFSKMAIRARADETRPEPGVPVWKVKKNFQHIPGWQFDASVEQLRQTRQIVDVTPPDRKGGALLCPVDLLEESDREGQAVT